ncbi:hypothetical protein CDS [Bradyrhizobium sp.]|nr:hypothetical protein CDS [Bradyrhizobium sp.]
MPGREREPQSRSMIRPEIRTRRDGRFRTTLQRLCPEAID